MFSQDCDGKQTEMTFGSTVTSFMLLSDLITGQAWTEQVLRAPSENERAAILPN